MPTVLLTRPEPGNSRLAEQLAGHGHTVLRYPALALDPVADPEQARTALSAALPADWLVFVSAAAVDHGTSLLPETLPRTTPVVAPGPGTARAARAAGWQDVIMPESGWNSEALLAMGVWQHMAGQRVLILNAAGGRQVLADGLRQRGAEVMQVHVYRRRPLLPPPGLEQTVLACSELITVITSRAVLASLRKGLSAAAFRHLTSQPVLVSSARLAALAGEAGFEQVEVTAGADADTILSTIAC